MKNKNFIKIDKYSDLYSVFRKLAEAPENVPIEPVAPVPSVTPLPSSNAKPQPVQQKTTSVSTSADNPHVEVQETDESFKKIKLDRRVTVEEIVEKINSVRAGRSLSNKNIRMQLEVYFDELEEDDKLSLFAFLTGISQIVTGEVSGKIATDPKDVSYHEKLQAKIDEEEMLKGKNVESSQNNAGQTSQAF